MSQERLSSLAMLSIENEECKRLNFGAAGMATPTVFKSKLDGKVLKSQTREVISNVMDFMSREGKEGTFVIDPKKVRERVATAVGVSRRTLTRISAEKRKLAETTTSFETPNKVRKVPKKVTGLDDFDLKIEELI
ncbi:hypothetical protein J6590_033231 [Homalodisca vitripennis]|nr:hypothetical protein J6590_033231 [Homalodisca vitripennis]